MAWGDAGGLVPWGGGRSAVGVVGVCSRRASSIRRFQQVFEDVARAAHGAKNGVDGGGGWCRREGFAVEDGGWVRELVELGSRCSTASCEAWGKGGGAWHGGWLAQGNVAQDGWGGLQHARKVAELAGLEEGTK